MDSTSLEPTHRMHTHRAGLRQLLRRAHVQEPALEQIDWAGYEFIKWLVCGGESGPGARPMYPDWARSARDWATLNRIPFYFKQWGGVSKKQAGRLLDGQLWDEYPTES